MIRYVVAAVIALWICSRAWGVEVRFNDDIRPILTEHCFGCHGADEEAREADLRLDLRDEAVAAQAIQPGKSANSELVRRLFSSDADEVMPPPGHTVLSDVQKQQLVKWIDAGAEYESHWAFTPPSRPKPPTPADQFQDWPRNEIDHFILDRMQAQGLAPSREASRYTLVRRLYLDLIGLPPTIEQARVFVQDDDPDAYEQLVDRLLDSKHFGEHWARVWLDLARYADTKGYEKDNHRDIWRYRDWVINAYNVDMPLDQFTMEQLAGDLLPDPSTEQLIATAFHRNTMTNDEGGTDNEEFRSLAVKDRVDTTVQVWMGLTMGCGKCHSHKYDPITQEEYYRFYSFFNQTEDADRHDEQPKIATPTRAQAEKVTSLRRNVTALEEQQRRLAKDHPVAVGLGELLKDLRKQLKAAENAQTTTPIMRELADDKRRETYIHVRGNFLEKGDTVIAATPAAFGIFPSSAPQDRRGVAAWLTQKQNPLTHRVAVNRVWSRMFGTGIVATEEDFGTQGAYPSHPRLLDWLAVEFRDKLNGSHKQLCKLIVTSATYRQSSHIPPDTLAKDPENRWLSHAPRFRLGAETVRDQALVAAGLLAPEVGGPSVMPPQPAGVWKATYSASKWKTAEGKDRYRRGLYTYWRRTSPYPSMMTFDAGSRETCLVRRIRTNIPLQALVTMNDPVYVEAAGALAKAVLEADLRQIRHRVRHAFSAHTGSPTDLR